MLVSSDRHTRDDLRLWQVQEDADFVHGTALFMLGKFSESCNSLIKFCSARKDVYAGISWGKDSVVVAHLLWCTVRDIPLIHLRPTNHNPDCDLVRDEYFRRYPGQPYFEVPVDYSGIDRLRLPDDQLDRETDKCWYAAIATFSKGKRRILGCRGEESMGRRIRMLRWGVASPNSLLPIGNWKSQDVFGYLSANQLPVHPVYAMQGGGRWPRARLRVAEIGDTSGRGLGRLEWEREYYGDLLNRQQKACR